MTPSHPAPASGLSALTWLRRNPRRWVPIALIQVLVTALEIAVVTPLNAFETTADAYIKPLEYLTIVTPLRRNEFDDDLEARLDENPYLERRVRAKMLWIDTPAIMGELSSPLLALLPRDQPDLLERLQVRLVEGKLPEAGSSGAAIHRDILRARGMKLGDEFGRIVNPKDLPPGRFQVVGVLEGESRVGVIDLGYASVPTFVLARMPAFEVVYAKPGAKAASDAYLRNLQDAEGRKALRVVDERWAREIAAENLENLPLIVGFITAIDAIIVAFVVMLISVISFQARTDEFALYLAVGHRRGRLVRKLAAEATLTSLLGWAVGLGAGLGIVALYEQWLLAPRSIVIRVVDAEPILYTLMVPVLSAIASAVALRFKLTRMDPVQVIQRRGA